MPAIQYKLDGHLVFVRQATGREAVEIWSKKGAPVRVLWKGFIADNNIKSLGPGGYGKMLAVSVTSESGMMCGWRQVLPSDYVLCYRVPTDICESGCAVYAVLDAHGWLNYYEQHTEIQYKKISKLINHVRNDVRKREGS